MNNTVEIVRGIIGALVVGGGVYLIARGLDGLIGSLMLAVVAWYFGAAYLQHRRRR